MKIVVFELELWERSIFQDLQKEYEVILSNEKLDQQVTQELRQAEVISTFIYSNLSSSSLQQFPGLRLIATRSTGIDHIDMDYCREHGITVSNVPVYADETVAEHVFALLLAISHNIAKAVQRTRSGSFSQESLEGFDLRGKTFGVIGTGAIGRHAASIAKGFDMDVIAFDVKPDHEAASRLGYRYVGMDELLSSADVITLHVPGTEKTRNLISRNEFSKMKRGTVLINTSRGSVVDTEALLQAILYKQIAAAGLDVLPEEPTIHEETELLRSIFAERHDLEALFAGHMLTHQSNVLVTPHSAFNTREAKERLSKTSVDNIVAFAEGNPQNVVSG